MDVHGERGYTLTLKKGGCKGDLGRVRRAQKLFHASQITAPGPLGQGRVTKGFSMDGAPDTPKQGPQDRLAAFLADDMAAVNALIRDRMASEHAPRIPEVTAHLIEAAASACARC